MREKIIKLCEDNGLIMSEELRLLCEEYEFDDNMKSFLKEIEIIFKHSNIAVEYKNSMISFIKTTCIGKELDCLSEKERFIFGVGGLFVCIRLKTGVNNE